VVDLEGAKFIVFVCDKISFVSVFHLTRGGRSCSWVLCRSLRTPSSMSEDDVKLTSKAVPSVCCSVLQGVAACCSMLQGVAACCSVLQRVAECCSVLSVLQCGQMRTPSQKSEHDKERTRQALSSVLQRVAACCSVLHRVVVCSRACRAKTLP